MSYLQDKNIANGVALAGGWWGGGGGGYSIVKSIEHSLKLRK
jgi:hypothetical protein